MKEAGHKGLTPSYKRKEGDRDTYSQSYRRLYLRSDPTRRVKRKENFQNVPITSARHEQTVKKSSRVKVDLIKK